MPATASVTDGPLGYLLSLPPRPAPRPLLCFLHGYGEAAPMDIERALRLHGPLHHGAAVVARSAFIVVAPQLPRAGDSWHRYADAVQRIVADAQAAHGGDPQRTYLTGFSFGGNGVFDLALLQPQRWAALWAVDPTRIPARDPGRPVWLSMGAIARSRAHGFIAALGLRAAGNEPHGDRLYSDSGHDHVGAATHAYAEERIYAWLLAHALVSA